jgi:hypothetical protein
VEKELSFSSSTIIKVPMQSLMMFFGECPRIREPAWVILGTANVQSIKALLTSDVEEENLVMGT